MKIENSLPLNSITHEARIIKYDKFSRNRSNTRLPCVFHFFFLRFFCCFPSKRKEKEKKICPNPTHESPAPDTLLIIIIKKKKKVRSEPGEFVLTRRVFFSK